MDAECAWLFSRIPLPTEFQLLAYLKIFTGNLLIELPFYFLALYRFLSWKKIILVLLLANLLTHPIVYFGFPYLMSKWAVSYGVMLIYAEALAVLIEIIFCLWFVKQKISFIIPFFILFANLFSWNLGLFITQS